MVHVTIVGFDHGSDLKFYPENWGKIRNLGVLTTQI